MAGKLEPPGLRTNKLNQLFFGKAKGGLNAVSCSQLSRDGLVDALLALYGECSQEYLHRSNKYAAQFAHKYKQTVNEVKNLQISINDFEVKDVIGRGHFGQVQVVREKVTSDVYAMKVLHKADTLSKENVAFYEEERDIMARASGPWLTKLQYAFQDDDNLYLIMEFHPGGDLLSLLARFDDIFEEPMARFYLAELVAAIHSLHTMGYVHRDIKPDNILLDRTGHIKLADFGSAAKLGGNNTVKSKMPVGTPDYVAPEVLMSLNGSLDSSYGTECDWWSLGIVAYEMMVGKTPFSDESMVVTYSNIMDFGRKLSFPTSSPISPRATSLIRQLLCDRSVRISYEQLGCHEFFAGIEWATLRDGVPPFVPTVSSVDDVSNFDEFDPIDPMKHNSSALLRSKSGFSGHDLPFVGFTYSKTASNNQGLGDMTLMNTTISAPLETDQRLQDRCRRLESQHSSLTRRNDELSKTLKEKTESLKTVQNEKNSVERKLAESVADLTKLRRTLEQERNEQKDMDSKAVRLMGEIRQSSKREQQLRDEQWRAELEEYKEAYSQLETDRQVAVKRAQKLEAELRVKTQECDDFKTQVNTVKTKLTKSCEGSRSEVEELQSQLEKLSKSSKSQLDELRMKLREASEGEERATLTVDRLRKEKIEIREAIQEQCQGSVQEMRASVMDLQQQLQESQDDQRSLENRLRMVQEREKRLQEQVESKHGLTQDLASQICEMENKVTSYERACRELEHDLASKTRDMLDKEQEIKQLRSAAKRDRLTLDRVSSLQADCEGSHIRKIQEQEESISALNKQVNVLQAQIDKMVADRHALTQQEKKEFKRVEAEKLSDLNQDRLYLQTQVGRLEFELNQAQRAKTSLVDQSKEMRVKLDKVADKYAEEMYLLKDQLRAAVARAERSEVNSKQMESSENDLKQQVRQLQTRLQEEIESAATKVDNLEGEKTLLDQELHVLRERSTIVTSLETQLREKTEQCSTMTKEKQELMERCESFAMEKGRLVTQNQQLDTSMADYQNKLEQNELNINMLKTTCTMLEEQVIDLETITERLETRLAECRQARDTALESLQEKEERLQAVSKALEDAQQAGTQAEQKIKELMEAADERERRQGEELDSWHKQFNEQRQQINELTENLSEVEKHKALLEVAAKELKQRYEDEQEDNIKLEKDLKDMEDKVKESKSINFQLTQGLEEAVSKGERIKEEKQELESELESQQIHYEHERIKFEGTSSQQTKLIDFLQAKVDAPPKKKKGRLFGKTTQPPPHLRDRGTGITGVTVSMQMKDLQHKLEAEKSRAWELQKALNEARSDLQAAKQKSVANSEAGSTISIPELPSTPVFTQTASANLISAIVQSPGHQSSPSSLILPTPGDKRHKALATGKGTMKRLKERMKHNIPHRFTVGLSMRGTKCSACADTIHFGRQAAKCQECHLICHPKCAHCLPHTCGLPFQYMRHFKQAMDAPSPSTKSISSASSTASSVVSSTVSSLTSFGQEPMVCGNQIQGWMKTPRTNKQGWEKKWCSLEATKLCIYDKENSSGCGSPFMEYDLCPEDGLVTVHAGVSATELPNTASSDLPFVFRLESRPVTTCWPDTKTLYLMAPSFQDKHQWMVGLEVASIRGRNAGPGGSMKDQARLIGNTLLKLNQENRLDINCTLLVSDDLLLIGAEEGLYTMLLMDRKKPLSQIGGVSSVFQMHIITQLMLAVMIIGPERNLCIVDLKHLRTVSSQASISDVIVNYTHIEDIQSCHLFACGKVDGSFYLCAAMPTKITILKYSEGLSRFCVRKEIKTAEPSSCLLFTETSILAGTDRFYEIELKDFKIDEFLESTDTSLAFAVYGASQLDSFPIAAIQVAPDGEPQEFLLCFHEFGIFVDGKGRRSRPDDMKWSRLPLAFTYRQPYLYMAHFNSVEVCEIKQNAEPESEGNRTFLSQTNPRFVGPAITPGAVYIASLGDRNVELMCLQGNYSNGSTRSHSSCLDTSGSTVGDSVSVAGGDDGRGTRMPPPPPVTSVRRTSSTQSQTPVTHKRSTRSSMKRPLQESWSNTPKGKFSRTMDRASARTPSMSSSEDEVKPKCGIKYSTVTCRKTRSSKR